MRVIKKVVLKQPSLICPCRSTAALKEDIDSVVNRHQKMQDEIAEDMIRMAHSLKNNSLVAKEIMLSDNKVAFIIVLLARSKIS